MEEETSEHVTRAVQVFIAIVLPLSLAYAFGYGFIVGENVLGMILWGIAVYFYSNFLPDLPSIYRKKNPEAEGEDLPWYKKYALLLFAPLLVWILFSGVRLSWRTIETYHNFTSLAVYGTFLFAIGFLGFGAIPLSIEGLAKVLFFQFCGVVGFLVHLKVDSIW
jgi:hypothetical protein